MAITAALRERITRLLDGARSRTHSAGVLRSADAAFDLEAPTDPVDGKPAHASAEIILEPPEIESDLSGITLADPAFVNFHTAREFRGAEPRRAAAPSAAFSRRSGADREVEVEVLAPDPAGRIKFADSRDAAPAETASLLFKATGYQALAIVAGLGLLSGSMFLLGLAAGYGLGLRQEGGERSAATYPLRAPVASLAESSTGQGSGAVAKSPGSVSTPAIVANLPPATPRVASASRKAKRTARAAGTKAGRASIASYDSARGAPEIVAPVSSLRSKGYSIQIAAVTDQSAADRMVAKLRHRGYQGYMVATSIGAVTWYKVRVGPFASEDEARWAGVKLRDELTLTAKGAASRTTVPP
jgi:cell division septation protein DedD